MTEVHTFCHEAMATEFEVVIAQAGVGLAMAQHAAAAVFAEVDRLEAELSRFKPTSDTWRLSLLRAGERAVVDFAAWDCLNLANSVHAETGGAFDITLGPLMRLWRNPDGSPRTPMPEELVAARQRMGMHLFDLDPDGLWVTVHADEMLFDFGAIGKGYALDQAVRVLADIGIDTALLSAGESTLVGLGNAPDEMGWPVNLHLEEAQALSLQGDALSCSGFAVQGNHIMDPRLLQPVPVQPRRSYVLAPTAALSDALSTAFMVLQPEEIEAFCQRHPQVRSLVGSSVE